MTATAPDVINTPFHKASMTHVSPSLASEIAALIGTPWQEGAEGPEAYDCWAAAGMIEARFFGRVLPGLGETRRTTITRARAAWHRCDAPRDGDIVEMRRMGRANHVGVWIGGAVLHCQRGAGMVYDRPDAIRATRTARLPQALTWRTLRRRRGPFSPVCQKADGRVRLQAEYPGARTRDPVSIQPIPSAPGTSSFVDDGTLGRPDAQTPKTNRTHSQPASASLRNMT